jgi:hypothetical protein
VSETVVGSFEPKGCSTVASNAKNWMKEQLAKWENWARECFCFHRTPEGPSNILFVGKCTLHFEGQNLLPSPESFIHTQTKNFIQKQI